MKANLEHYRHQVHQFGSDILQVEAFLDFMIGSVEAAYNTNTNTNTNTDKDTSTELSGGGIFGLHHRIS